MPILVPCRGGYAPQPHQLTRTIQVTTLPTKSSYNLGETLNLSGMVVKANKADGSQEVITGYTTSLTNGSVLGKTNNTITVSYTDTNNIIYTTSFNITIRWPVSIAVTTPPTKTVYVADETLSTSGMVVTATYNTGATANVTSSCTFSPANGATLSPSNNRINISFTQYGETVTTYQTITVKYITGIYISTPPTRTTFFSGESLSLAGMVVTATYNNGTTGTITDYTVSPTGVLSTSNTSVTISATNNGSTFTATQSITVNSMIDWATGTASEIKTLAESARNGNINLASYWSIGQERSITLGSPVSATVKFVIVDLKGATDSNYKGTTSGGTEFAALVGQKNGLSTTRQMNSSNTNSGGYNSCAMKTWIDDETNGYSAAHKNATSNSIWDAIIPSSHVQGLYNSGTTTQTTSGVKFILHSSYEIFGSNSGAYGESTTNKQIPYYNSSRSSNRKKRTGDSGSYTYWWFRSARSSYSTRFCVANSSGSSTYGNASSNYLVAPFGAI